MWRGAQPVREKMRPTAVYRPLPRPRLSLSNGAAVNTTSVLTFRFHLSRSQHSPFPKFPCVPLLPTYGYKGKRQHATHSMAQYYNSTASTSLSRLNRDTSSSSSQTPVLNEDDLNQSIYIFPDPSASRSRSSSISLSIPPSSPFSPASPFSGASDYWAGSVASPSSRLASVTGGGTRERTISVSTAAESTEVEVWTWEEDEEDISRQNSERGSRWEILGIAGSSRHLRTDSNASPSSVSFSGTLSSLSPSALSLRSPIRGHSHHSRSHSEIQRHDIPAPHPAIRIPLLSFLSSFLSIDESTLHLLRHTPSTSALFPDLPRRQATELSSSEDGALPAHGLLKLFLCSASENDPSSTLIKSLNVMYEKDEEERVEERTDWVVWSWLRWAIGQ
ncbi:hypothetical protein NEOLEDRAFT_547465 [Neolentinus lepideus HHB14362 ss-1]|uniref:Uncharacterized protein n=1 Tax=Neolentinus lepideus HHB14362 ss-1 TaxID=1314782 RepID=A0A165R8D1_9AGAM|nr:hypothetical protein NEOLEDRAFT_547465 [Neolentinus lepideus HHB14362 ss-1]